MRNLKVMALGALLILWGGVLQAAQPVGMYEAEVEVADQGREARAAAMREAMADVLLKVAGRATVLEEEAITSAMANAARFVQQYRYRSEAIPPDERGTGRRGGTSLEQRLLLQVSFDHGSIDKLLQRFGFNVWSAARPATLAWLAVEDGKQRQLVGANDRGLVREVVEAEALRRAIPLRLPLLDLTDQSKVRPVDVWGGFMDNIVKASARYESEAVLVGKLYKSGKLWEARWTLLYQGERHEWVNTDRDVSRVISSGVSGTADFLATYFASRTYQGVEQLALNISDVTSMAAFRQVNDYLLSLHGVKALVMRRVDASAASFVLDIEGGNQALLHAIHMGDVLVEVEPPPHVPKAETVPESKPELAAYVGPQKKEATPGSQAEASETVTPVVPPVSSIAEFYFRLLP